MAAIVTVRSHALTMGRGPGRPGPGVGATIGGWAAPESVRCGAPSWDRATAPEPSPTLRVSGSSIRHAVGIFRMPWMTWKRPSGGPWRCQSLSMRSKSAGDSTSPKTSAWPLRLQPTVPAPGRSQGRASGPALHPTIGGVHLPELLTGRVVPAGGHACRAPCCSRPVPLLRTAVGRQAPMHTARPVAGNTRTSAAPHIVGIE